jgi:hypothetical protein
MFLAYAFAHVKIIMATLVNCFKIRFFPIGMISVDMVQVYPLLTCEIKPTGCTFMVLPCNSFRGFPVIELAVTLTPVGEVSILRGFLTFDFDVFIFGGGNQWERFI